MEALDTPQIDEERFLADLDALAQIGSEAGGAVHRVAFSEADRAGRRWVIEQLEELGLDVRVDTAGNTLARYAGEKKMRPLGVGSHTDTVPHGGRFDGALGVVAAIGAVRALVRSGTHLRHPVEVIDFAAEEATMAGGTTGSQAMAGTFDPALLDRPAWDGVPVRQHLVAAGLEPEHLVRAARPAGDLAAYLELHIEQGDRLLEAGLSIGVVEGFVGIRRYLATFEGSANHAGTTGMSRRRDALVAAAPLVTEVDRLARELDVVATVGALEVHPGAPNVIPGRVEAIVEMRGPDRHVLDRFAKQLERQVCEAPGEGVRGRFELVVDKPAVQCDVAVVAAIEAACSKLGEDSIRLTSGAGHDAMNMATLCPQSMIFVPSQDGVSHSAKEFTTAADCVVGAKVLLATLLELDRGAESR